MPLTPGTVLGSYEIVGSLGAGGMGEVYRARDLTLKRDVALKVLPPAFTSDPDRLARFQREAELLATLNDPHIAAIYGLHRDGNTTALILELVEGETLADHIARGPIPIDEAVRIATQIAAALESAHGRAIVHRDLKPANIKLRPDGTVKVLDFGLAKALDAAPAAADASLSPTITSPAMTHAGVILGTAAYMSPEQARGHAADERSDIWAFGCVLLEMLTGGKAFPGDDVADTLASVLRSEPDWPRLPAETPESVRRLLRRCLRKDRSRRLADIRDARLELDDSDEGQRSVAPAPASRLRERLIWSAAVTALAIAIVALAVNRQRSAPAQTEHTYLDVPATTDPTSFSLSPDGRQALFVGSTDGRPMLWHYSFDTGERQVLRGTAGAADPFWSADSRSIGYFSNERLYTMDVDGGTPRERAAAPFGTGATWNRDDVILYTPVPDAPVLRVPARVDIGDPLPGSSLQSTAGERYPQFLPDGRRFIYFRIESKQVFLGSLDTPERSVLVDGVDSAAVVAPPDRLLFVRGGELLMQHFDPASATLVGQPVAIGHDVAINARGGPAVTASSDGSVVFRTGSGDQPRQLVIVDREGTKVRDVFGPDKWFPMNPDLCPDGKRVVLNRTIGGNAGIDEIDLERGIPNTLTQSPQPEIVPVCSRRGIVFVGRREDGVSQIARFAAGTITPIVVGVPGVPLDEADDGTVLYRAIGTTTKSGWDIFATNGTSEPRAILSGPSQERGAQFSPDGKWLAYESNEYGGVFEILVQSYPPKGVKQRVSYGGGSQPRWDGNEIYYIAQDGWMMSVTAEPSTDGTMTLSRPKQLFRAQIESTVQGGIGHAYAVFPGGKQFLLSTFTELPAQALKLIRNIPR